MTSSIARVIPGFGGETFAPGAAEYDEKRAQYASTSYPEKQGPDGSMRPYLIAYPRMDSDDIPAAISFARANNKRLVARSGGHQYCGLSSGGDDTVLLSMDLYKGVEIKKVGDKTLARVGVGMRLTDVAAAFKEKGVTIPHGECPLVAIGGHVQSGGYGHLLRSYGLALDHVLEFKIYTSDGVLRTVRRPPAQDRGSLFWGVLGGGPGSFGIVTEVTFECIRDADHPYSSGSQSFFCYEKSLFRRAMNEVKAWTEKVLSGDPSLPQDVDMNVSLIADKFFGRPGIIIEMANGNRDGRNDQGRNRQFLEECLKNITSGASALPDLGHQGNHPLSFISDAKVRRDLMITEGREFAEPYKKRLNCTKRPLSDAFVDAFVDLTDRVVNSGTVKLVIQILIGGGAYASPEVTPPLTSICHRDMVVGIVFDCFYTPSGLQDAEGFQAEMRDLLKTHWSDQEVRMLWGSFGDTVISKESVRSLYYDDLTWNDLQRLKQQVDADDLFHTEFTVQLPLGKNWRCVVRDRVAVLTFTRPPRNYLDFGSIAELGSLLESLAKQSTDVSVVMLTSGVDGFFIAHGDLTDLQKAGRGEAPGGMESWLKVTDLIRDMPQPVVAAIDGQAWGAGNELAMACQLRVGSTRAHLGNPEVKIGIIPGGGGSQRLPRLVGAGPAADAILRGRVFRAEEALALGWLNAVLPAEGFVDAATSWCQQMVAFPQAALFASKKVLVAGLEMPLADGIKMEIEEFLKLVGSSPEVDALINKESSNR